MLNRRIGLTITIVAGLCVKATVGASQKTSGNKSETQRAVIVVFDTDGKLRGCDCSDCPAGLSMTCCHVAAVLHSIINTLGLRQKVGPSSPDVSPTSVLCKWTAPTKDSVSMTIDAVQPQKHSLLRGEVKKTRAKAHQWDPRSPNQRSPKAAMNALRGIVQGMLRLQGLKGIARSPLHYQFPGLEADSDQQLGLPIGTIFLKPVTEDLASMCVRSAVAEDIKINLQKLLTQREVRRSE